MATWCAYCEIGTSLTGCCNVFLQSQSQGGYAPAGAQPGFWARARPEYEAAGSSAQSSGHLSALPVHALGSPLAGLKWGKLYPKLDRGSLSSWCSDHLRSLHRKNINICYHLTVAFSDLAVYMFILPPVLAAVVSVCMRSL
jgi:hypothetical protein